MADFAALLTRVTELEETATGAAPLRAALDALLAQFPLCFGYWKRLAELELAHDSEAAAVCVYERAAVPCAHSVDMWTLYCAHAVRHWAGRPDRVRTLFERAVPLVGSDYAADPFWDKYLSFEAGAAAADPSADQSRLGALYVFILELPLRCADAYWTRFVRFAATCGSSHHILDEAAESRLKASLASRGALPPAREGEDDQDDGARKLRVMALLEASVASRGALLAEQVRLEAAVRRRHFHVRPLERSDLEAWRALLSWHEERSRGSSDEAEAALDAACLAHERALVACAAERELWLGYAFLLEARGRLEAARAVLRRASGVFFTRCVVTLLAHAAFEEEHSSTGADLSEARRLCAAATALRPPSLEAFLAQANLERRAGDAQRERGALSAGAAVLHGDDLALLVRHAAAAERRLGGPSAELAGDVVERALRRQPDNELLWDVAVSCALGELQGGGGDGCSVPGPLEGASAAVQAVASIYERMLPRETPLSAEAKRRAWVRYQMVRAPCPPPAVPSR